MREFADAGRAAPRCERFQNIECAVDRLDRRLSKFGLSPFLGHNDSNAPSTGRVLRATQSRRLLARREDRRFHPPVAAEILWRAALPRGARGRRSPHMKGAGSTGASFALAQATLSIFHLMTHYANDFFDRESDALTRRTRFSGGSGVLIDGSLDPRVGHHAAYVCLALGAAGTLGLLSTGHGIAACDRSGRRPARLVLLEPSAPLLGRGLGELDTCSSFASSSRSARAPRSGAARSLALASALPAAAAMFAMMIAVEVPDVEADTATGKRNLVVRLGRPWAFPLAAARSCLSRLRGVRRSRPGRRGRSASRALSPPSPPRPPRAGPAAPPRRRLAR